MYLPISLYSFLFFSSFSIQLFFLIVFPFISLLLHSLTGGSNWLNIGQWLDQTRKEKLTGVLRYDRQTLLQVGVRSECVGGSKE